VLTPVGRATCATSRRSRRICSVSEVPSGTQGNPTVVIGEGKTPWWDAIIVVEYPSPGAFLDMVTNDEYLNVHEHRAGGLDRGDLIATSIWNRAE
jgi:hypothetical protein